MKSEAYLGEIREIEGLKRAVLKKIVVEGKEIVFHLVTDLNYTREDRDRAQTVSQAYVPAGYTARVQVVKSVPSAEGVRKAVLSMLAERYPAAAAFVSPEDIRVETDAGGGAFFIGVSGEERAQFTAEVTDALTERVMREFCGVWTGHLSEKDKERGEIVGEEIPPEEPLAAPRTFEICGYAPIDGAACKRAVYIADLEREMQGVTVCGKISFIEERMTKKDKPYFSISLSDGTGALRTTYFGRRNIEKIRMLTVGSSVCLTGDNELYNGGLSFRTKQIDRGAPPEGFVPAARPSRPVPARYTCVTPTPVTDYVQSGMFGEKGLPEAFLKRRFVVFDLETTGLNTSAVSGNVDRIIEIGAVKIAEGNITEKFSTFVSCPIKVPADISAMTGITDDMLVGAPAIGDVIADFYKFCDGCSLVGHNAALFDIKLVRYYGEKEGYLFSHPVYDTIPLSQEVLRLSNYKLNTIADHFGFTFNHHRAYDDAFVTAKIFLELVRQKGTLP